MIRIVLIVLFLCTVAGAVPAYAQTYKWIDGKGAIHFTDDPLQVPEKYRAKVERIPGENTDAEPAADSGGSSKKKEEVYKDQLGRGEEFWRGRVDESRTKLRTLQESLEKLRAKYNEFVEKFNDSRSTAERAALRKERDRVKSDIDRCRNDIEEVRKILDKKIPEEAEVYKAKSEWVK